MTVTMEDTNETDEQNVNDMKTSATKYSVIEVNAKGKDECMLEEQCENEPKIKHKEPSNDDIYTVWIGQLHKKVTEEILYELFLQAGPIESLRIPKETDGTNRSYGFIEYVYEVSVPYALALFEGTKLFGREIRMNSKNSTRINVEKLKTEAFVHCRGSVKRQEHCSSPAFSSRPRTRSHAPTSSNSQGGHGLFVTRATRGRSQPNFITQFGARHQSSLPHSPLPPEGKQRHCEDRKSHRETDTNLAPLQSQETLAAKSTNRSSGSQLDAAELDRTTDVDDSTFSLPSPSPSTEQEQEECTDTVRRKLFMNEDDGKKESSRSSTLAMKINTPTSTPTTIVSPSGGESKKERLSNAHILTKCSASLSPEMTESLSRSTVSHENVVHESQYDVDNPTPQKVMSVSDELDSFVRINLHDASSPSPSPTPRISTHVSAPRLGVLGLFHVSISKRDNPQSDTSSLSNRTNDSTVRKHESVPRCTSKLTNSSLNPEELQIPSELHTESPISSHCLSKDSQMSSKSLSSSTINQESNRELKIDASPIADIKSSSPTLGVLTSPLPVNRGLPSKSEQIQLSVDTGVSLDSLKLSTGRFRSSASGDAFLGALPSPSSSHEILGSYLSPGLSSISSIYPSEDRLSGWLSPPSNVLEAAVVTAMTTPAEAVTPAAIPKSLDHLGLYPSSSFTFSESAPSPVFLPRPRGSPDRVVSRAGGGVGGDAVRGGAGGDAISGGWELLDPAIIVRGNVKRRAECQKTLRDIASDTFKTTKKNPNIVQHSLLQPVDQVVGQRTSSDGILNEPMCDLNKNNKHLARESVLRLHNSTETENNSSVDQGIERSIYNLQSWDIDKLPSLNSKDSTVSDQVKESILKENKDSEELRINDIDRNSIIQSHFMNSVRSEKSITISSLKKEDSSLDSVLGVKYLKDDVGIKNSRETGDLFSMQRCALRGERLGEQRGEVQSNMRGELWEEQRGDVRVKVREKCGEIDRGVERGSSKVSPRAEYKVLNTPEEAKAVMRDIREKLKDVTRVVTGKFSPSSDSPVCSVKTSSVFKSSRISTSELVCSSKSASASTRSSLSPTNAMPKTVLSRPHVQRPCQSTVSPSTPYESLTDSLDPNSVASKDVTVPTQILSRITTSSPPSSSSTSKRILSSARGLSYQSTSTSKGTPYSNPVNTLTHPSLEFPVREQNKPIAKEINHLTKERALENCKSQVGTIVDSFTKPESGRELERSSLDSNQKSPRGKPSEEDPRCRRVMQPEDEESYVPEKIIETFFSSTPDKAADKATVSVASGSGNNGGAVGRGVLREVELEGNRSVSSSLAVSPPLTESRGVADCRKNAVNNQFNNIAASASSTSAPSTTSSTFLEFRSYSAVAASASGGAEQGTREGQTLSPPQPPPPMSPLREFGRAQLHPRCRPAPLRRPFAPMHPHVP